MTALAPMIDERNLWMPPHRMARYQWVKIGGGLLMIAIFLGWLVIQWSNPPMRWFAMALLGITAWVVIISCVNDRTRSHGRQLAIKGHSLVVTLLNEPFSIPVDTIAYAQWREDDFETAGLWLFDAQDRQLAHLDLNFIGDQNEARSFLQWARDRVNFSFEVHWPAT